MGEVKRYWFPARKYGWGWGMPTSWHGWLVMAVYAAILFGGGFVLNPDTSPLAFMAMTFVATVILVIVMYRTGEPPRWRWGGDDKDR